MKEIGWATPLADVHFARFQILRKEKFVEKVHGSGRLHQAYIEYIARKRSGITSQARP